jgi:hypothetical protein
MSLAPLAVEEKYQVRRRDICPALLQTASAAVVHNPADNQADLAADHTADLALEQAAVSALVPTVSAAEALPDPTEKVEQESAVSLAVLLVRVVLVAPGFAQADTAR